MTVRRRMVVSAYWRIKGGISGAWGGILWKKNHLSRPLSNGAVRVLMAIPAWARVGHTHTLRPIHQEKLLRTVSGVLRLWDDMKGSWEARFH